MTLVIKKHELEEFYNRWNIKAEEYSTDTLSDYFDKFFTLYVIYNRSYNVIFEILADRGEIKNLKQSGKIDKKKKYRSDSEAATVCVVRYLEQDLEAIVNDLQSEITEIKDIIKHELFYIDVYFGKHQRKKDLALLDRLNSSDRTDAFESLLTILYKLRCNMFHGEKGFDRKQEIILEPSISILSKLNRTLMTKIMQEQ